MKQYNAVLIQAVIWRPLREEDMRGYDPESTLELRAARLLDKVCKEFCEWLKNLGGTVLNEETLKDMFEINFSSEACKTIQVSLKKMLKTSNRSLNFFFNFKR